MSSNDDDTLFAKTRAALIDSVYGSSVPNPALTKALGRQRSLAAFIDLMRTTEFSRWVQTELESYLDADGDTSLEDLVAWLESHLRG